MPTFFRLAVKWLYCLLLVTLHAWHKLDCFVIFSCQLKRDGKELADGHAKYFFKCHRHEVFAATFSHD